jgi:REP element-mobilizing transposase RayT
MKLRAGLPTLRSRPAFAVLAAAFSAMREREHFRLVHYSVQSNHLHLICEARDRTTLSRGIQALAIRIAKRLNSLWQRAGKLFADRYHDRVLRTPREVRNALAYVLNNAAKHGVPLPRGLPDPCSSGRWFTGWKGGLVRIASPPNPLAAAKTWLLSVGWLRGGRVELLGASPNADAAGDVTCSSAKSSRLTSKSSRQGTSTSLPRIEVRG